MVDEVAATSSSSPPRPRPRRCWPSRTSSSATGRVYNVRLRDDKSYPYIGIWLDEDFPRIYFTRERHRRGRAYFGPFSNAKRVRETLDLLGKVFQYRTCDGPEPGRACGSPCLDYFIKRCQAPCVGYISQGGVPREHRHDHRLPVGPLPPDRARRSSRAMREAAEEQEFEQAAVLRNRLKAVRSRCSSASGSRTRRSARSTRSASPPRAPTPTRRSSRCATACSPTARASTSRTPPRRDEGEVAEEFVLQYYASALADPAAGDRAAQRSRDAEDARGGAAPSAAARPVEVRHAERGDKRRIFELAERNARLALDQDRLRSERRRSQRIEALERLQRALEHGRAPDADRVLRHLEPRHAAHGRVDGGVRGRRAEEVRLPPLRDPGAPRRTTSRRWQRCSHGGWRSTSRSASARPHDQELRRELRRRCRR